MWKEISAEKAGHVADGVRLPIIISVHHQSEEACVHVRGRPSPIRSTIYERQYGGRRGAWRLLEIMSKHGVRGTWIICGATCEKYPQISREVKQGSDIRSRAMATRTRRCANSAARGVRGHQQDGRVFEDKMGEQPARLAHLLPPATTPSICCSRHFDFEWDASIWNDDLPYMIEGHGNSFLEIPFSHYSDAAYSMQMHNPSQPINPFTTWEWNTPDTVFRDHEGAVRRAVRTRRRAGRPDADDGARLHHRPALALQGVRRLHRLCQAASKASCSRRTTRSAAGGGRTIRLRKTGSPYNRREEPHAAQGSVEHSRYFPFCRVGDHGRRGLHCTRGGLSHAAD